MSWFSWYIVLCSMSFFEFRIALIKNYVHASNESTAICKSFVYLVCWAEHEIITKFFWWKFENTWTDATELILERWMLVDNSRYPSGWISVSAIKAHGGYGKRYPRSASIKMIWSWLKSWRQAVTTNLWAFTGQVTVTSTFQRDQTYPQIMR